ncbi:MAG: hypothetical protein U9P80_08260 [Thermodesulfobacteriota bacterium]|nr:hypothetical protein [Thermodesulfobacteriota bacterium]
MDTIKREYSRTQRKMDAVACIHLPSEDLEIKDCQIRFLSHTKDISWAGICLKIPVPPKDKGHVFTPSKAHRLKDMPLSVTIHGERLTLWGSVIRYDARARELALIITKTSDYHRWQKICGENIPE